MHQNRNGYSLDAEVAAEVRSGIARSKTASIKGISERIGIRRATLSQRVNGHVPFSPSLLAMVAAELGTTASELVARAEQSLEAARNRGTAA